MERCRLPSGDVEHYWITLLGDRQYFMGRGRLLAWTGNICESFTIMGRYFMERCRPPALDGEHFWIIISGWAVLHWAWQAHRGGRGTLLNHYLGSCSTSWGGARSSLGMGKFCSSLFGMGSTSCGGVGPPRGTGNIYESFTVMGQCSPPALDGEYFWINISGRAVLHWAAQSARGWRGNVVHHCSWWSVLHAAVQAPHGQWGTFVNHSP